MKMTSNGGEADQSVMKTLQLYCGYNDDDDDDEKTPVQMMIMMMMMRMKSHPSRRTSELNSRLTEGSPGFDSPSGSVLIIIIVIVVVVVMVIVVVVVVVIVIVTVKCDNDFLSKCDCCTSPHRYVINFASRDSRRKKFLWNFAMWKCISGAILA